MTNDPSSPAPPDPGYPATGQAFTPSLFEEQPPPVAEPSVAAAAVVTEAAAPPTDRVWPNLLWDAIMLLGAIVAVAMLFITGSMDTFAETGLRLAGVVPVLLLAIALGVSVRAGAINLAVVHLAAMATILYAVVLPQGEAIAWLVALGAALGGGIVVALLVVLLRTPAWAAGIFVAVVSMLVVEAYWSWEGFLESWPELELTSETAWLIVAGIAVTAIIGGVIGILRPVRRLLTRTSQSVEQTGRSTPATAFTVIGALALSGVLAGAAGILSMVPGGVEISAANGNAQAFILLAMALAIVLLGGTSARGGRGGVIGTVCAAIVLYGLAQLFVALDIGAAATYALPLGLLLVGFIVSRILGGGRRKVIETETPDPTQPEPTPAYPTPMATEGGVFEGAVPLQEQGFAQTLPTHPAPGESQGTVVGDPAMQQYWPAEQSEFQPPAAPEHVQPPPTPQTSGFDAKPVSPAAAESAPPGFEQPDPPPDPYQYRPPAQ